MPGLDLRVMGWVGGLGLRVLGLGNKLYKVAVLQLRKENIRLNNHRSAP